MNNAGGLRGAREVRAGGTTAHVDNGVASSKPGRFLLYIHQFRAVAIVFVIASHTVRTLDWSKAPVSLDFVSTVFGNGTFLFVFIAGFIFQYLLNKYDTRAYYSSKLKNVILPYLIVGFPAIVLILQRDHVSPTFPAGFEDWSIAFQVIWLYGTGTMLLPLWFIPMISMMFVLGPLLARANRSGSIYRWLPLMLLVSLFIPRSFGNDNPIQAFMIYFPVYVLGMWSSRNINLIISLADKFWMPLVAGWLAIVTAEVFWFSANGAMYTDSIFIVHEDIINVSNIDKALLCYILIYLLYRMQHVIGSSLNILAESSFGLFFLHEYFIFLTKWMLREFNTVLFGNILVYLIYTFLIVAVTLSAVLIAKHVLGSRSRLVIGS